MKVLIVEDNADSRKLLMKQLRAYGCEVIPAADGAEALVLALAQPPDIVVSDILMPKMDGYQLCHEWKQIDRLKAIPFIFYTATYTKDEDKKFAESMGVNAFIVKPADPDVLINIVRETVEKTKSDSLVPHFNSQIEQDVFLAEYGKRVSAKLEEKVAQLDFETGQRKRSEEALKKSETQLKGAQVLGRIGSWEFDFETRETTWSEETYVLYERNLKLGPLSPEEEQQQYYSFEQAKVIRDYWAKAIDTGLTLSYDTEVILPSGKKAFYHVIMQTVKGYQEKAVKMSGTVQDITERKRAEEALKNREEFLNNIIEKTPNAIWVSDEKGTIIRMNQAIRDLLKITDEEIIGKYNVFADEQVIKQGFLPLIKSVFEEGKAVYFTINYDTANMQLTLAETARRVLEIVISAVKDKEGRVIHAICQEKDVTEQKQAEKQRELSLNIFQLLNKSGEKKYLIRNLLKLFKEDGQYEAVGIRLRKDDDFPYFETIGFSDKHIKEENRLFAVDDKGNPVYDSQGIPVLGCMCGSVISGRCDPLKSFFTGAGSFWTNSTTDLLASTTGADTQERPCKHCIEEGYESVALVPLKANNTTLGLLQINDSRRNLFTSELIRYYEGIAQSIGIALEAKQAEEALQVSENKYRDLYRNAPAAYYSVGADGLIKESNKAAQLLFGYTEAELSGKPRQEIYAPECATKAIRLFEERFSSGESVEDEEMIYLRKDGSKVYGLLSAVPVIDKKGHVVVSRSVVKDISERKRAEDALQHSYETLRKTMDSVVRTIAATVEMRDPYTAGHQRRVALLARSIARELGLLPEHVNQIYTAGIIHDIGKMQVPAEILSKPGKLSDIEFSLVKMHAQVGYDILKNVDFPYPLSRWVLEHHERLNGSGYPNALTTESISLEAKILAVADVTEAMASHRPYRAALGMERALAEISQNRGILYDTQAVDACLKLIREQGFSFE